MNPAVLARSAKNLLSAVEINLNRAAGREFVPNQPDMLHIETCSTCNLKCRFCAYVKKDNVKVAMKDEFFADLVAQAVEMGYCRFELTPCTGDVFMDHHLFNKLDLLEANPAVETYQFFTNFTILKPQDVERLVRLKKLCTLTISIYGHDLPTFIAITQSNEKIYRRLIGNLETLFALLDQRSFDLNFGFRSTRDAPRHGDSEIMRVLARFAAAGIKVRTSNVYSNWGGYISQEDVKGLAIDITKPEKTYKNGACTLLLTSVQITANGIVNGCACKDVDASLCIGDLNEKPLRELLSTRNPAYMALIEEQQRGAFRPVCQSCDYYKSIYHQRSLTRKGELPTQSLAEFKARLDAKQPDASVA
jgi:sulfatase maturation enzyme AslB (radical SAM superfamily)